MTRHQTPGRGGSAPIGDQPRVGVSLTLDAEVLEALKERAKADAVSVSQAANEALERGLEVER